MNKLSMVDGGPTANASKVTTGEVPSQAPYFFQRASNNKRSNLAAIDQ
jgi:hypothetical protein